jgi:hypothetical protein
VNAEEDTLDMIKRYSLLALLISGNLIFGHAAFAEDKDVDQADTLDFQSFHKDKKEAVKVWKDTNGETSVGTRKETIKTYEQTPAAAASSAASVSTATPAALTNTARPAQPVAEKGQRFEIRERYTLTRSAKTPYSAFYVIEPLYKQAAQLCPKGWKKLSEKSEPVEQDFYLYYEIECQ